MELESQFSPHEFAFFEQNGYAIVRGLGPADIRQRMIDVTHDGVARLIEPIEFEADVHYPGAPTSRTAEGGRTVRRLQQALTRDHVFLRWVQHPNVVGRLKQILGPEIVCPLAHHNCIMTKEPRFSSDTGWHQDVRYWSFSRPQLVNVWLALGSERPENGCLSVIPGSHRQEYSREQFDDAMFLRTDWPANQELLDQAVQVSLEPGDVLFFHCLTFHAASRNHTQDPKLSVVFTFRGSDNLPIPGTRSADSPELLIH